MPQAKDTCCAIAWLLGTQSAQTAQMILPMRNTNVSPSFPLNRKWRRSWRIRVQTEITDRFASLRTHVGRQLPILVNEICRIYLILYRPVGSERNTKIDSAADIAPLEWHRHQVEHINSP